MAGQAWRGPLSPNKPQLWFPGGCCAGQRRELCRDRLRALLAGPLRMRTGSSRLEQGFSCPESSNGILLGSGSG